MNASKRSAWIWGAVGAAVVIPGACWLSQNANHRVNNLKSMKDAVKTLTQIAEADAKARNGELKTPQQFKLQLHCIQGKDFWNETARIHSKLKGYGQYIDREDYSDSRPHSFNVMPVEGAQAYHSILKLSDKYQGYLQKPLLFDQNEETESLVNKLEKVKVQFSNRTFAPNPSFNLK